METHSGVLEKLRHLFEDHSEDHISLLKKYVSSHKRLQREVEQNRERLIARKRDEKLSRKELQKIKSLHPTPLELSQSLNDPKPAILPLHE